MKKQLISILVITTTTAITGLIGKVMINTQQLLDRSNALQTRIEQACIQSEENAKKIELINQQLESNISDIEQQIQEIKAKIQEEEERRSRMVEFTLTFYTTLNEENGWGPINCLGEPLAAGMVANNVLPLGTKIDLGDYGVVEVRDRGGNNFNVMHRIDYLVMRNPGESDREYFKRVNNYGVKKVMGYIVEE